jgi:hypothetical protein
MFDAFDPIGPLGVLASSGLEVPQGNPGAVSDAAGDLQVLAGALDEQGQTITSAAHTAGGWEGSASSAYGTYSGHLVGVCSGNAAACKDAAAALLTFSAALAHAQAVTSQAVADFNTAASAYTQHRSAATSAGLAAQTARLNAASAADPATHEGYQRTASTAEQEQVTAQKAAATAQTTAEAAQQRGQQALAAYEQDVKMLTTQLQTATARLKPAPALPGTHAAAPKGGGGFWSMVLPLAGMVVLDGAEEFFSAGFATPAVVGEDGAIMGAEAAATDAADSEVPTVVFSRAKAPEIGKNFDEAVNDGHPTTLNRVTSKIARRANRRDALAGHTPAPAGQSLDEYPFASSSQGGAGARVAPVPAAEQNYQGGVLGSFYQNNGILDGDPFNVRFDP